ncbi:DUF2690 domain-containing protein [Streptomyces sp. TRM70308]|uniref:helix-turn-helix domain-containing protein n=1 Tax=Streptomyces sp. TRM70308 TaxID=3131932 RepID=UPI003D01AED7
MPRWKPLPEELDPQIREFAEQMRRLVDRSGLGLAALADRTGYSKTSWERYLSGRLLPPQGAISALAEVTGTDVRHLATLWELAERAWSRSEMRHDMTMEAIRISQAREALRAAEEQGPPAGRRRAGERSGGRPRPAPGARPAPARADRPAQPAGPGHAAAGAGRAARARRPAGAPGRAAAARPSGARRAVMLLAGGATALAVLAAAFFVMDLSGGGGKAAAEPTAAPSTDTGPDLPEGVRCTGEDCTGEDPELMGCGGRYAQTVGDALIGAAYVELRYSEVCGAGWARVAAAQPGDTLRVTADSDASAAEDLGDKTEGYTMMVPARDAEAIRACVERAGQRQGCTL